MCTSKSKSKSAKDPYAAENARRAAAVTDGMAGIDAQFAGYDEGFYGKRAQDYTDYATPQVAKQYDDAYKQLVYALSRSHNTDSSAGVDAFADLQRQKDVRTGEVVDGARAAANQARSDVAGQRSDLVTMLNSTFDPTATMQSAQSRTALLNSAPSFNTLGDLFTLPTALAADQVSQARYANASANGAQIFQKPAGGASTRVV